MAPDAAKNLSRYALVEQVYVKSECFAGLKSMAFEMRGTKDKRARRILESARSSRRRPEDSLYIGQHSKRPTQHVSSLSRGKVYRFHSRKFIADYAAFEGHDYRPVYHRKYMLILASQSPRRKEILSNAGIDFSVRSSSVDESLTGDESPIEHARRLARMKAFAVSMNPGEVILGADTIVIADDEVFGKPADEKDARRMLAKLSGRNHIVTTAICLRHLGGEIVDSESTLVHFAELSANEIAAYAASGEPRDKAGAYAIQGLASKYIDRVEGCYFNVVGLPIALVWKHLRTLE